MLTPQSAWAGGQHAAAGGAALLTVEGEVADQVCQIHVVKATGHFTDCLAGAGGCLKFMRELLRGF